MSDLPPTPEVSPPAPPPSEGVPPAPPPSEGVPPLPPAPLADVEKLRSEVARLTSVLADWQMKKEVADRATAQQLAVEKAKREELEGHLKSEIDVALAAIPDEAARRDVADSIGGLDPLRQRKLLGAFAATSVAPKTTRPGAPGSPRGGADYKLMSSPGAAGTRYRADLALAALKVAKGK